MQIIDELSLDFMISRELSFKIKYVVIYKLLREENNLQHTLCPRYIRVNTDAVSIEVKRNHQTVVKKP